LFCIIEDAYSGTSVQFLNCHERCQVRREGHPSLVCWQHISSTRHASFLCVMQIIIRKGMSFSYADVMSGTPIPRQRLIFMHLLLPDICFTVSLFPICADTGSSDGLLTKRTQFAKALPSAYIWIYHIQVSMYIFLLEDGRMTETCSS
jgi:hypothetical protein